MILRNNLLIHTGVIKEKKCFLINTSLVKYDWCILCEVWKSLFFQTQQILKQIRKQHAFKKIDLMP